MDPEVSQALKEMRKLERQAKQLLYKMERLEKEWNEIKKSLSDKGRPVPHQLGDVLFRFNMKRI